MTQPYSNLLQPLNVRKLSALEFYQLGNRLITSIEASQQPYDDERHLFQVVTDMTKDLKAFQKTLEGYTKTSQTARIDEADKRRNDDFRAFSSGLKAYAKNQRSEDKESHDRIKPLLKQHSDALKANHEKSTAHYRTLINKLEQAPYKADVTNLGLTRLLNNFKESQEHFEQVFERANEAKRQQTSGKDVHQSRQQFHNRYQLFLNYLLVMTQVSTELLYPTYLTIVNQGRKYYADSLAHKHKQTNASIKTKTCSPGHCSSTPEPTES